MESISTDGKFCLADNGRFAELYVDSDDYAGVVRAVGDLQSDIKKVTGRAPKIVNEESGTGKNPVIVGTIGKSRLIDKLIKSGKIDISAIEGKWESFLIDVIERPVAGVENALVIIGSDKRGTIYGVYEISKRIGVSPWYWWADVPVKQRERIVVEADRIVEGPPAVKYRGIFLNDEAPALSGWVYEKFGGFNHKFYIKVFELLLRLRGNYLWPAMWDNSFYLDDPNSAMLADEYGIVMGTSHHEPMMRAWKEWKREGHGKGSWDYSKNPEVIREFWSEGIRRTRDYEKIITLAMRGDGDEPMSEDENVAMLERIVSDQRKIISEMINPDVTKVPQVWALYKEVQKYYEEGMRIPDDVTLLWCDDNWGNIRRLPTEQERKRSGGAGVYYHFDYVGAPRSYKWINTTPITKIWEQMNLAYRYGADRIWIVNVGDLKPMEFPIEFFLTFAWEPQKWPVERIPEYTRMWAEREFGTGYAEEIAEIVTRYTKYNSRRKPELLEPDTYSLVNYREAERVLEDYREITEKAEKIYTDLPDDAKDAFFQLVLYPTKASAIVTELYITVGMNHLYNRQWRASTDGLAEKVRELFAADAELSRYYNEEMAGGKWNHMMDQTRIGYSSWNDPPENVMPEIKERETDREAGMSIAVEGDAFVWPGFCSYFPALPEFSVFGTQKKYIDIFNRGQNSFGFTADANEDWLLLSNMGGIVDKKIRIWVGIDWNKAPAGISKGSVVITGSEGSKQSVAIRVFNPREPEIESFNGFVEANGYVSIEAEHYTRKIDAGGVRWEKISDYGRTLSAMTIFPVTAKSVMPPSGSPCLEYKIYLFSPGEIEVETIFAPTLNFVPDRGLRYGICFDEQEPQVIDIVASDYYVDNMNGDWAEAVRTNSRKITSSHTVCKKGKHTLKIWMVDPAVVLEKIIVNTGGLKSSYLGPPESFRGGSRLNSGKH